MQDLINQIKNHLTDDLRKKKYQGHKNKYFGHCYVASETLYHLLGGKSSGLKPMHINHENQSHWFLKSKENKVIDITVGQFVNEPDYNLARGIGFLTKKPSKRTQLLIKRIIA